MKWFQHDADASTDAKVKKLILRHGAIGYAVYFHCLELIAGTITMTNINFELEHDAEIIADNLKIQGDKDTAGIDKVNNIMRTIIQLGLFEESENRIFCFQLAKRLDNTVSRSPEIGKIKEATKKLRSNYVETTKKLGADEIKSDEIKSDEIKKNISFIKSVIEYLNELSGRKFKYSTDKYQVLILARKKNGYSLEEFKTVINNKSKDKWFCKEGHMNPVTLFGTKFDKYLNERIIIKTEEINKIDKDLEFTFIQDMICELQEKDITEYNKYMDKKCYLSLSEKQQENLFKELTEKTGE